MDTYNTTKQGRRNIYYLFLEEINEDIQYLREYSWTTEMLKTKRNYVLDRMGEIRLFHDRYRLITYHQMRSLADSYSTIYYMIEASINALENGSRGEPAGSREGSTAD